MSCKSVRKQEMTTFWKNSSNCMGSIFYEKQGFSQTRGFFENSNTKSTKSRQIEWGRLLLKTGFSSKIRDLSKKYRVRLQKKFVKSKGVDFFVSFPDFSMKKKFVNLKGVEISMIFPEFSKRNNSWNKSYLLRILKKPTIVVALVIFFTSSK